MHKNNITHGDIRLENTLINILEKDYKNTQRNDKFEDTIIFDGEIDLFLVDFEFG